MMEPLVARPERPARARDSEAPRHAAEERQDGEAAERHPYNACRDRDERAHDRGQPAEEDSEVAETVEPAVGAIELRPVEVEPAAALLEQGPSGERADPPAEPRADGVPDHACERHHHEAPEVRVDPVAEEDEMLARERPGGE